jgi:TetR/AcrR family transcriptional regulator, mexJK operon transcriptional repressor
VDEQLLDIAADMVRRGQPLSLAALAKEAGVSRSTAHRRTGGRGALLEALADRGVDGAGASTRTRLLTAAREAVAAHGLVGVSVEALADRAGVSAMTVYRLFGDRESLLREALAGVFPRAAFEVLDREDATVAEALQEAAAGMVRFIGTCPGLMALMLAPASADRAELMHMHGLQRDVRVRLAEFFERRAARGDLPPGDALARAGAFSGLCLGASLLLHEARPLTEDQVAPRAHGVVRTFLAGVAAERESREV